MRCALSHTYCSRCKLNEICEIYRSLELEKDYRNPFHPRNSYIKYMNPRDRFKRVEHTKGW